MQPTPDPPAPSQHACSQSHVAFARAPNGRSFVASQLIRYPLHVTVPFALREQPAGMATLYLQSVSGGLYDGDDLTLTLRCEAGAAAHVTTQSPGIVHAARAGGARQVVQIEVAADALLEFLPDPVVMFPDARLRSRVQARLAPGATLMLADGLLAHDPAGDGRLFSLWDSRVHIVDASGRPLLQERLRLDGAAHRASAARAGGLGACQCALLLVRPCGDCGPLLDAARAALAAHDDAYAGATTLGRDAGVYVRIATAEADRLAAAAHDTWSALRRALTGSPPARRRK